MPKAQVNPEIIENFLSGNNPKKYVVAIEATYNEPYVELVINDPERGKYTEKAKYKPFLWFKDDVKKILFNGKRQKAKEMAERFGVRSKKLQISDPDGYVPERLENGFKYLAICDKSYNELIGYFKAGGIDIFDKNYKNLFFVVSPVEQFMIQTGIRMFKGMDDYNDLHRFQFDLETEGLTASKDAIFQIGMRDNRGFEQVLEIMGTSPGDRRNSERYNIQRFFEIINELKPDIITGYNSEAFDWKFILERAERLGINYNYFALGINGTSPLRRRHSILKLGNEMEHYEQTYMYGYNILDIGHSVRRAQAINSDIKSWGLKYITQYSGIAKKNRVYVKGDKINATWSDSVNTYAFNETNGDWYKISDRMPLKDGYQTTTGNYIVQRYLLDDLWETEQIDTIYNQAAFLISKLLPTTYTRSATMGTAGQWKLIMAAWSYENGLGIPDTESKREFTGGLSRLLQLGYARNVAKLDFAALYPKTQLTHHIFPLLDISGVMEGMLTYVVDTRDKFKFLTGEHKDIVKKLTKQIEAGEGNIEELKEELKKHKALATLYDKKQLPLKILANSWFGAYGAPYTFNWGDSDCAEETTCRGRQYLRLMVRHFTEKFGFKPLVLDTDGVNFEIPQSADNYRYTPSGSHWKTKEDAGKELSGLDAILAEFNETFMIGRMGLDIDDVINSSINFSRKNYANDIGGKIKLVGNSIKSKKMPLYIEDFLDKAIRYLLDGKGKEFIELYYEYVDKIYNYNIPLVKIASKSKVKTTISEYKAKANKKNKAGNPMPKQAHMELAIQHNLNLNLGDVLYYVNTGTSKSQPDLKSTKDERGIVTVQLNCKLLDLMDVDNNLEILKDIETLKKILETTEESKKEEIINNIHELENSLLKDEYNANKYLEAFNKKVEPLLVCFHPDIRSKILLKIKKDRKTKLEKLEERMVFSDEQCQLVSGMPDNPEDQDSYEEDLMKMEDKEIKFWHKVNKVPNNMPEDQWREIEQDYLERMRIAREEGIRHDIETFEKILSRMEKSDYERINNYYTLPDSLLALVTIDDDNLVSRKWDFVLGRIEDIFKYEEEAYQRAKWYEMRNLGAEDGYDLWLEYKTMNQIKLETKKSDFDKDNIKETILNFSITKEIDEDDEDNEEEQEVPDVDLPGITWDTPQPEIKETEDEWPF